MSLVSIHVDNLINFLSKLFKETLVINPLKLIPMDEITDMWDFEFGIKDDQYWVMMWDINLFLNKVEAIYKQRMESNRAQR